MAASLERMAGWISIAAGLIHGAVMPEHFQEWWGYGLFFMAAALAQVLFGLALLTDAIAPQEWGPSWRAARRGLYRVGIVLNVSVVVLYAVTRTIGIPLFGPSAGQVEEVAVLDLASKLLECALVVLLFVVLAREAPDAVEI